MINKASWITYLALFSSCSAFAGDWEIEVGGFFSYTDTKLNAYDPYFDKTRSIDFESDLELKEFTVLPYLKLEYYF